MKKEALKFSDSNILEGMTSISALLNSDPLVNDRKILRILVDSAKRRSKSAEIGFLVAKSHEMGFPIEFTTAEEIDRLAVGTSHGGILAFCSNRTLRPLSADLIQPNSFYVYMDGIEDPYNFGNAIRSLYAAGVAGVVVPPRNWMSAAGVVARASAGASERLPILVSDANQLTELFHQANYRILCAGIRDSISVYDADVTYPVLLVVGGEKRGISGQILEKADRIVRIDYGREFRGSLSASASAAVLAFEFMRQNRNR